MAIFILSSIGMFYTILDYIVYTYTDYLLIIILFILYSVDFV